MPDAGHGSKTEHDFCPGGGTLNQYSERAIGEQLSDWTYEDTGDKIVLKELKKYPYILYGKDFAIPSEFEEQPGKSVEIQNFDELFKAYATDGMGTKKNIVSLKIGTPEKKVTLDTKSLKKAFYFFVDLETIDLSGLDTSNVTDMSDMFTLCRSLKSIRGLETLDTSKVENMESMFYACYSLESLDLSNFNTENVTNMRHMFYECSNLKSLDVSNFDTKNVTDMYGMFRNCENLQSLDISGFNTENVTNMMGMFAFCESLEYIDVSNFDTKKVTNMNSMFAYCYNLESLDVSHFNTENVTNIAGMFNECHNLKNIDISNFDTKNVTNMMAMFSVCTNLESLDLSNFDTKNVMSMQMMFAFCSNLKNIKGLENFNTSACKDYQMIFFGCDQLNIFDIGKFEIDDTNHSSLPDYPPLLFVSTKTPLTEIDATFSNLMPFDEPIPTIIISRSEYLLQNIDSSNNPALILSRTPYYAKVVYHSNDGVFTDGSTSNEKMLYQSDHIIYSTMEEAKKDFTFTGTEIVKDAPVVSAGKERMGVAWYLDEACTKPLTETDTIDFTRLENGTLQLYAGYKEETPEEPENPEEKPTEPEETPSEPEEKPTEPEEKPNTPNEEGKGESNIEEIKKEESEAVHTGDEVSKGMYYVLLGGSVIVFAAMLRKNRSSEQ